MKWKWGLFLLWALPGVLTAQEATSSPCPCCAEVYRQFDFWVGDWVTYNLQQENQIAGKNKILLLQDKCVIQENWVSSTGQYTGTSYNWYDPQSGKWHQAWIDNQGGSLRLTGGIENGNMVMYSGEMKTSQGEPYTNRITWIPNPDGSVRQHWEISKDGGSTWQTAFDGLYKRWGALD